MALLHWVSFCLLILHASELSFANLFTPRPFIIPSSSSGSYTYQSYQKSITCTASDPPLAPRSLSEIQNIVNIAIKNNQTVKAVGSLHSMTDCICTEGVVINMTEINHFSYDSKTKRATAGAGMELMEFLERLHKKGRALENVPTFSSITLGGATGTGAHGTSLKHPASLSNQLFSVTFVDGHGKVRRINSTEEDFKAFRVHLGLLGVVYEVVFETIEQYKLEMHHFPMKDDVLWDPTEITKMAYANDVFQFWWFPTNKVVVISMGNRTSVKTPGNCETHWIAELPTLETNAISVGTELIQAARCHVGSFLAQSYSMNSLYKAVPERTPFYTESDGRTPCLPRATGYSHKMMTNGCEDCLWEQGEFSLLNDDSSFVISVDELLSAINTLRDIFEDLLTAFPLGIQVRFLKGSDAYIGTNSGRDSVSIEWVTNKRLDPSEPKLYLTSYLAMGQALVKKHQGRPHWAKNGLMYQHPDVLSHVHPQLDKFIEAMEKYDPRRIFMNDLWDRIRDKKNHVGSVTMDEYCGLSETCLCKFDRDCGKEGASDYRCGKYSDYRVCHHPDKSVIEDMRTTISRAIIEGITTAVNNEDFIVNALTQYVGFDYLIAENKRNGKKEIKS